MYIYELSQLYTKTKLLQIYNFIIFNIFCVLFFIKLSVSKILEIFYVGYFN